MNKAAEEIDNFVRVLAPDGNDGLVLLRAARSDRYKIRVAIGGARVDLYFSQEFLLQARDMLKSGDTSGRSVRSIAGGSPSANRVWL